MTQQLFDDRFTYTNTGFSTEGWDTLSDQDIAELYPEFTDMMRMVRRHSVVISKAKPLGIYDAIVNHADPRIAMILAARRRKQDATPMFGTTQAVKEALFGPPTATSPLYENAERNMLVQGIRRVSAALAASVLIGGISQIEQQFKHSVHLEKQALADLDAILQAADIVLDQAQPTAVAEAALEEKAFFFERLSADIGADIITVQVYLPAQTNTGWTTVNTYTGLINTATIVGDITDTINQLSLINNRSNIIAAPIHASLTDQHRIEVSARSRDLTVSYEVITIRITRTGGTLPPFRWGVDETVLTQGTLNSALLRVQQGKIAAVGSSATGLPKLDNEGQPTVLYFRRLQRDSNTSNAVLYEDNTSIAQGTWAQGSLVFRLSPYMTQSQTVIFPYIVQQANGLSQSQLDQQRYSQIAQLLLEEMFALKSQSRTLGAIIRNDPLSESRPIAGVELVSFRVSAAETYSTLDILQLPRDIEMAIGDLTGPLSTFSTKPRSIRVRTQLDNSSGSAAAINNTGLYPYGSPDIVSLPQSRLMSTVSHRYKAFVPAATQLDGDDVYQEIGYFETY